MIMILYLIVTIFQSIVKVVGDQVISHVQKVILEHFANNVIYIIPEEMDLMQQVDNFNVDLVRTYH